MKFRFRMMRLLTALLAVCLLFSSCSGDARLPFNVKGGLPAEHARLSFPEIEYERPDFAGLEDKAAALEKAVDARENPAGVLARYRELLQDYVRAETAYTLADVRSTLDVTDSFYAAESAACHDGLNALSDRLNGLTGAILDSPCGKAAREEWGEDYVARYERTRDLSDPAAAPLLSRENELASRYREEYASFTIDVEGRPMGLSELISSDFSYAETVRLEIRYYQELNREMGEIFLAMLPLRLQTAEILGQDGYAAYAYRAMNRDFTPEDAALFCETIKRDFCPVYRRILDEWEDRLYGASLSCPLTPDRGLSVLEKALEEEFPSEMAEALDYMLDFGLYDFEASANKAAGSYSTEFSLYNAPFLSISPTGTCRDASTLFHEFGHYSAFYLNSSGGWNQTLSQDLAEVQSQGLELLMLEHYDELYRGKDAEELRLLTVKELGDAMVSGCMEDEFQRRIYSAPSITLEEINALYMELRQEYFGDCYEGYPINGLDWVDVHHTFEAPFYYISYAVSAAAALGLWEKSPDGRADALEAYGRLAGVGWEKGFREALASCGLEDPMSPDFIRELSELFAEVFFPEEAETAPAA